MGFFYVCRECGEGVNEGDEGWEEWFCAKHPKAIVDTLVSADDGAAIRGGYESRATVAIKGLRVTAAGGVVRVRGRGEDWLTWEADYDRTVTALRAFDPYAGDADGADCYRFFREQVALISTAVLSKTEPPYGGEALTLLRQARTNDLIGDDDVPAYMRVSS